MQELQDEFGFYPMGNTRFNSTVIDDDDDDDNKENLVQQRDCPMEDDDDDGVEISQSHSTSMINEKCLLDELLQTEEVRKERGNHTLYKCHTRHCYQITFAYE